MGPMLKYFRVKIKQMEGEQWSESTHFTHEWAKCVCVCLIIHGWAAGSSWSLSWKAACGGIIYQRVTRHESSEQTDLPADWSQHRIGSEKPASVRGERAGWCGSELTGNVQTHQDTVGTFRAQMNPACGRGGVDSTTDRKTFPGKRN